MKLLPAVVCTLFTTPFVMSSFAYSAAAPQTFPTSAGVVKITPLYHASTLIEAGGKVIYLDPAKPAKFSDTPKADLILITDIHGDHMDPASIAVISKPGTDIQTPSNARMIDKIRMGSCIRAFKRSSKFNCIWR